MTGSTLLSVEEVSKRFGGLVALDGVNLTVNEGEILGLIGPNGAGKSTLMNVISSVYPVSGGRIVFEDTDITSDSVHTNAKRGIVRTFQDSRHFEEITGYENIRLAEIPDKLLSWDMYLSVLTQREESPGVARAIEEVGLSRETLAKTPTDMTHLERIQLAIARALTHDPELLMLDEPFAGLSKEEVDIVAELVTHLNDLGITILLIDHNVGKVTAVANRVAVLHQGSILTKGSPEEIIEDEQMRAAYLGE
ncbi:ABC transporter ATP-binding protein [Halorarius litoreus]|uniref:ABC transporter ATP-binding protein n=1 Tax=Halorarius litoreus TaxID=2962676 RepID=UPI0020CD6FFA|nr:ABC transporter ATP-binding protein [Halorarius litoreus]